jgi:purine-nucleoside phosphorylase
MNSTDDMSDAVATSAAAVRARLGARTPRIAVLLGSGWGGVADAVQGAVDFAYEALPAFPVLGVGGHAGTLRCGTLGTSDVLVLSGRKHAYETGEVDAMKGAIRTLAALGCHTLLQTNAAGSLREDMRPGALMLLIDHLNIPQHSPLFGERGDERFVGMSDAYDPALREKAQAAAKSLGMPLLEGVYAWVMGPQFETPAEIRMLQSLGAHAVGMSTVPETILARHAGLRVLALSMITNMAAGLSSEALSHAHTLHAAGSAGAGPARLVEAIVSMLED